MEIQQLTAEVSLKFMRHAFVRTSVATFTLADRFSYRRKI
ncbi:predicted protein [Sclerotinia sclerotiorum 1980 UF-70]|uniref:Uncharacterized protein n=1 Tax=Sclerotinia sclerotiorum (strain ATCC 18683 / 1980 / Ss-1) TaxID=665079 RepID=A7E4P8_SCLS1|nr:predicted protein [Sclerotinia sclerotiorum 1980 UF-70]EDN90870.1 predicted protein [Sclerotinia sclerotiorum 1980 UF-70]